MAHAHAVNHGLDSHHHEPHPDSYYVKIWAVLLVLLVISVIGPMLENPVITLLTAFGIAIIKALIVCAYFMHLNLEKRYITYLLLISLLLMVVMFAGISPDVLNSKGANWESGVNWKWEKMNIVPVPIEHHDAGGTPQGAHEAAPPPAAHH